jgi:hypothetical protein
MKNRIQLKRNTRLYIFYGLLIFLGKAPGLFAQSTTVLPGNGVFSSQVAPQGAAKYQRQFYLITAAEVAKSGLKNNDAITIVGFNIAAAQDTVTKGKFKVYLQNTTDTKSRLDTGWTTKTVNANSYAATGLVPGNYEWQVRANCSGFSNFGNTAFFSNNSKDCYAPTSLTTDNITTTSASFHWIKPASTVTLYQVEYNKTDGSGLTTATTTDTFLNVSGLEAGKYYQWKVKTACGSNNSEIAAAVFTTSRTNSCNPPGGLTVGALTDSTAVVQWTAATGAKRYDVEYRRLGTTTWQTSVSFINPDTIRGLLKGTDYEWRVRTVCGTDSTGAYVAGANFTTTGTKVCYPPVNLVNNNLTDSTASFTWTSSQGAASYELRYRIKETISWTNATSAMTLAHNDSITVPRVAGHYRVAFSKGTSFTYTGGGIYVAYEYENIGARLSTVNNAVATNQNSFIKDSNGNDSLKVVLSLGAIGRDSLPATLSANTLRPETTLGTNGLQDSVEVVTIYTAGNLALPYGSPTTIKAVIKNHTAGSKQYNVLLTVKDKNNTSKFTNIKAVTINSVATAEVTFDNWSPTVTGVDSIIVSVAAQANENVINNNRKFLLQNVNNSTQSYDDATEAMSSVGFDTSAGLILSKQSMKGCAAVNAAKVYLHSSAIGKTVYAVVLDSSGSIVATSPSLTPDSSQVNRYQTFYFSTPAAISNANYYIGLAQVKSNSGYLPVGVQLESPLRSNAFYKAKLNGEGLAQEAYAGRLMIRAEIITGSSAPVITGNLNLCPGSSTTLKASKATSRYANSVIAVSSQSADFAYSGTQALGTPNVYPAYGINSNAWQSKTADGQREFLVLSFPGSSPVNFVDIYETFNPGAIDTVFLKNASTNQYETVYSGTATKSGNEAKIKRITFPVTSYNVSEIRIALNSAAVGGFNSIDAVAIGKLDTIPSSSDTYLWSTGASGSSINVTAEGTYTVTVTGNSCAASVSATVVASDQTAPVITAIGSTTLCTGKTVKLRSSKVGGNVWSTGATTDSIIVNTAGSYSVTYNNGSGCGTLTSNVVSVTEDTETTLPITGTLGICPNGSTTLNTSAGYANQVWSNGATTQSIIVVRAGTYSVYATNANGCRLSGSVSVASVPAPTPNISGRLAFCPGANTTLQTTADHTTYLWSTGATTRSINVSNAATYSVSVTNSFGCTASTQVVTTVYTPPSPKITGSLSLCGGSTTLNAGGGYGSYAWNTGSVGPTISPIDAGTYTVTVIDANGCTGSASAVTSKDSLPRPPGAITGDGSLACNTSNRLFSVQPVANTSHYVWTLPTGATFSNGQDTTSNSVRINFPQNFSTGYLTVSASNSCGQSASIKPSRLLINGAPNKPGTITGAATGVCGPTTKTYTIASVPSASSYSWTIPAGASISSGQGTASVSVSFSAAFKGGDICVRAVSSCGSSPSSCLSIKSTPTVSQGISGRTSVCPQEANVSYYITPVSGATSYTWTVSSNARIVFGQGTNSIKVNFSTAGSTISVKAVNACGSSNEQTLNVSMAGCRTASPADITTTNTEMDLQRLKPEVLANDGGTNKQGDVSLDWTLGEPAVETVKTIDKIYTQGFHQPTILLNKTNTDPVVNNSKGLKVVAAPNPVSTMLKVLVEGLTGEQFTMQLTDMSGKVLVTQPFASPASLQINMSGYSSGMYILVIRNKSATIVNTIKIVKAT